MTATQILPSGWPKRLGVDGHCETHLLLSFLPKYDSGQVKTQKWVTLSAYVSTLFPFIVMSGQKGTQSWVLLSAQVPVGHTLTHLFVLSSA